MKSARLALACTLVVTLVACAPAKTPAPDPAAQATALSAMVPSAKRAQIATSFPAEVPVVVGTVVRGEAQGTDAWDYEIEVAAPPSDVVRWYHEAYAGRNWVASGDVMVDGPGGGGTAITFRKGGAESRVTVYGTPDNTSIVRAILGVGAPVLQTQ